MRAFARSAARALAPKGITVNLIMPGKVRTDRLLQQAELEARSRGFTVDEILAQHQKDTPTGRLTEPEEVARAIVFLACGRPANLTGAELVIDGGAIRAI